MAINNKPSVPAPAIFSSDPLEQIFARGIGDDAKTSGLKYMFMSAFGDRRRMDQQAYMAGVERANEQSVALGQQELQQAQHEAMLKAAIELSKLGADTSTMPNLSPLFNGKPNTLQPELMRSQIHKNYQAGESGSGGGGVEVKVDQSPNGVGFHTIKGKGANAVTQVEAARQAVIEQLKKSNPKVAPPDEVETMRKYRSNQ